ncbi:MAG: MGMT family protein, partial [Longimicrobiales bacterium]|nr:MGMT family protein [Longimicrobiales bacterium]
MRFLSPHPGFAETVHRLVRSVPHGRVTSYGAVAAMAGAPRAARGVGSVLRGLAPEAHVPWWRVVNRNGEVIIPAELGLRALQRTLLEGEGVEFLASGRVDMAH